MGRLISLLLSQHCYGYSRWSKLERETPIQYINTYIWNLDRWQWWPYRQKQQKRHRCIEQTFGLCGRRQGLDELRENHWNMYIIICETDHQSRFDAWDRVLRAGALGWPWGMGWGRRWKGFQDWEHMYTHGWFMSMYGKNHYNIVN